MDSMKLSTSLQSALINVLEDKSTVKEMLTMIVIRAAEVLESSDCTIYIVDAEGQTAALLASTDYQHQFEKAQCRVIPADKVQIHPRDDEKLGLTGWILSTGKSFLARTPEELARHPHHSGKNDPVELHEEESLLQTFLGVPLRGLRGEVIGLIKAERRAGEHEWVEAFSVHDQIVLETVARVASKCLVYLDMARTGNTDAALTAWARDIVGEAAATEGELDSFLDIVVDVMASAMRADSCAIYLIDESKKTLTQRAGIGSQAPRFVIRSYPLPSRNQIESRKERVGLTAWIAATGQSFYAGDFDELSAHPHHRGEFDRWNFPESTETICGAFLGVPLRVGGTIIGVLKVENISRIGEIDSRCFPKEAQWHFDVLAQEIALSIMRLQEQSGARYQVISDAQPTIFEILRGGLDVPELAHKVVTETAKLFNARASALFLKEGKQLIQPPWAAYGWYLRGPEVREYKLVEPGEIKDDPTLEEKVGLTVWIAAKQEKFTARSNLELVMHPHHTGTFDEYNFEEGQRCESFMGVPLTVGGKLVGVLKVETKMKKLRPEIEEFTYFSEQDELVFDLIANSAAIAIENARLLESQRLAEQVCNQPQNLLLDLHDFVKDHWHAAGTLNQAADLLRGKRRDIANIIENYAALLQPEFHVQLIDTIVDLLETHGDFLDQSGGFSVLYRAFEDALQIESLVDISRLCSSPTFADPQLLQPYFFLSESATTLADMYRQIAASLRREGEGATERSSLEKVIAYLTETKSKADTLTQPEQNIIHRIIDQWLQVVGEARAHFRKVDNPYVAGPPIDPGAGSHFFGRRDIFDWVSENLHGATQKNVLVLHGERRMGKTSILLQLERGALGKPLRERGDQSLCPVYINLQSLTDSGTHRFLHGLTRHIVKQMNRFLSGHSEVKAPSIDDFKEAPYTAFNEFMANISKLLDPVLLVLMFDEFEVLERLVSEGKLEPDIYGQLRHQMQFPSNVTFILAGTHQLQELSDDYKGIVFTVALHREVGFMDDTEARALVQQPVEGRVTYASEAVDELLRATNGHPYLLQLLCQHLISEMNRRAESNFISVGDVRAAIEYFADQRGGHLKYVMDQSTKEEQAILYAIAGVVEAERHHITYSELTYRLHYPSTVVMDALHRLIRRRLIEEVPEKSPAVRENSYRPTMALFSKWICRHSRLARWGGEGALQCDISLR